MSFLVSQAARLAESRNTLQKFLAAKAEQGFCKNLIRGMRMSLGPVLGWAIENKWIPESPCRGVKLPEAGTKIERTILKRVQVLAIVNELEEPYATFVLFLAITGLRVSEAVGVRWSDIEGTALHSRDGYMKVRQENSKQEN